MLILNKVLLYVRTIRYLKFVQIFYQLKYRVFGFSLKKTNKLLTFNSLNFNNQILNNQSYLSAKRFRFLNIEKVFSKEIDWNDLSNGKLWNYNLNYFDFLNQKTVNKKQLCSLIEDYINNYNVLKSGLEPYPTSLRIINLIKFISENKISNKYFLNLIVQDTYRLCSNLEYHLLANHLLENSFALWFSSHLINDKKLRLKSCKLLHSQLNEQILNDGAHYELSPMYHNIILYRLLDCIQISTNNKKFWNKKLIKFMKHKASIMLGWINQIDINKNEIPLINDSTINVAPTTIELNKYAKKMGISVIEKPLNDSGFRILKNKNLNFLVDVSNISPGYQPGHSHADSLNYLLYFKNKPIIVDPGITTYEDNKYRRKEKGSDFHNVVVVNNKNSSDIWGSFRIGKRAFIKITCDEQNKIIATHNGFKKYNSIIKRTWENSFNSSIITDTIIGKNNFLEFSSIHFHPDIQIIKKTKNYFKLNNNVSIKINGNLKRYEILDFYYSSGFNKRKKSKKIKIYFKKNISFIINDENFIS